jgi:hypothetical protein
LILDGFEALRDARVEIRLHWLRRDVHREIDFDLKRDIRRRPAPIRRSKWFGGTRSSRLVEYLSLVRRLPSGKRPVGVIQVLRLWWVK